MTDPKKMCLRVHLWSHREGQSQSIPEWIDIERISHGLLRIDKFCRSVEANVDANGAQSGKWRIRCNVQMDIF